MTSSPRELVRLGDLVEAINTASDDPLTRVTNAMQVAEVLGETADAVLGHYVDQARRAGASWSEIGRSMGTSKQAAQKRFVARGGASSAPLDPSQGFSRFRDDARAVVVSAQQRARDAGNDQITVSHLVLGLTAGTGSPAARAIEALTGSLATVDRVAAATLPPASAAVPELIPFDAHARTALEGSFSEAQRQAAEDVGSEHLLLSILRTEAGTGILAGLGVTLESADSYLTSREGE